MMIVVAEANGGVTTIARVVVGDSDAMMRAHIAAAGSATRANAAGSNAAGSNAAEAKVGQARRTVLAPRESSEIAGQQSADARGDSTIGPTANVVPIGSRIIHAAMRVDMSVAARSRPLRPIL